MTYYPKRYRKKKYDISSQSDTINSILALVYRKNCINRCGENIVDGLEKLGLLKKVISKKGTFYFKTEKSESFTTFDFAEEYLWNFHNPSKKSIVNNEKFIFCYSKKLSTGRGLVNIKEAIQDGIV